MEIAQRVHSKNMAKDMMYTDESSRNYSIEVVG